MIAEASHSYRRYPYHPEDVSTRSHMRKFHTLYTPRVARLHLHFQDYNIGWDTRTPSFA